MNTFSVPKKVNRHVLKALHILCGGDTRKRLPMAEILNQVKYQMRNLVPVQDIEEVLQNSLKNLSDLGLIERSGPNRFSVGRLYAPPAEPIHTTRRLLRPAGSRKRSASHLDPNVAHSQRRSEDSLSGKEIDRTRKRLRSINQPLRRSVRGVNLPKARQHNSRPREYAADSTCNNIFLECASLAANYRVNSARDGDLLMSESSSNTSFELPNSAPPESSFESIEIPYEHTKSNDGATNGKTGQ